MSFAALPAVAAWQHQDARSGFEVVFFRSDSGRYLIEGCTAAVEDGEPWVVEYAIELDADGRTQSARVFGRSAGGARSTTLDVDESGRWLVDGVVVPELAGCVDVDLESSAMTNALPVRRLNLAVGERAAAPSAYVRAADLRVERLDQTYSRVPGVVSHQRFDYAAPRFDFTCQLDFDESGLVDRYPGIATRAH